MSRRGAGPQKDQKTGTWCFVVDLGPGPDGKRHQARRRGFKTKKKAQEELDRLRVRVHEGTFVELTRVTVSDYLETWLEGCVVTGLAPSTVSSYRRLLRSHVIAHLGGVRLQSLQPGQLDQLYARLLASGLSPRTVRYAHSVVRKGLSDAMKKGLVVRNVADAASPPSARSAQPPEMGFWSPAELDRFLVHVSGDALGPLFHLTAMTGLRRGEVCGLRWADVDLEDSRVTVRRQLGASSASSTASWHSQSVPSPITADAASTWTSPPSPSSVATV